RQVCLNSKSLSVAREYLAPDYRGSWKPDLCKATIIDSSLVDVASAMTWSPVQVRGQAPSPPAAVVRVASDHVETLRYGNIVVSAKRHVFEFSLAQVNGEWRIEAMNPPVILLTQPDFQRDYQPRNLYFLATNTPSNVLVPYPTFIPQQAETQ